MDYLREMEGKSVHDCFPIKGSRRPVWVPGPVIVGAGPSGLATAALLKEKGIPSLILERANCIASLWQLKSYDRLCLHLPKQFCELPLMPFPANFPRYPSRNQFISYLEDYASKFDLEPKFNETVKSAEYDESVGFWRVSTSGLKDDDETEYMCRWLIVASGENADPVTPKFQGLNEFSGYVLHSADYKRGDEFQGKKVLVVGCGNSGMEVSLDLSNYNALPTLVVRDTVHVLPREMLGRSTFGLSMWLLKWFPISLVDRFVLLVARATIGDTAEIGLPRPSSGPFQLKNATGKTPVLDVGTLSKIRAGQIKVCPELKRFNRHGADFADGTTEEFDFVIFATGYSSNVPSWLKETKMFSEKDGFPRKPFPNGWKGECGLYAVGFGKKGLLGVAFDSTKISEHIECCWKAEAKHNLTTDYFRNPLQSYHN